MSSNKFMFLWVLIFTEQMDKPIKFLTILTLSLISTGKEVFLTGHINEEAINSSSYMQINMLWQLR